MNENAKLWVAALRSGKYTQVSHQLSDGIGYCCLGVACEVYQTVVGGLEINKARTSFNEETGTLPSPVQSWLRLSSVIGTFEESNDSLANHNDEGDTFSEIADLIESEPQGLFTRSE